ncbi:MAG: hypothetical protein IPL08_13930 [Saprospiraceae bacterium]|nr:hypothetical protein [Saprospiraceae bacterium]
MRNVIFVFFIIISYQFAAYAQPSNDQCSNAITLTQGASCVSTAGNTTNATDNNETGDCTNGTEKAVWYKFVATGTSAIVQVTGSSGFDAFLGVINACGASAIPSGGATGSTCIDVSGDGGTETANLSGLTVGIHITSRPMITLAMQQQHQLLQFVCTHLRFPQPMIIAQHRQS